MLGVVDDIHGDELGTEGHDIELCTHSFICLHHLQDRLPLDSPPRKLENWSSILLRCHSLEEVRQYRVVV